MRCLSCLSLGRLASFLSCALLYWATYRKELFDGVLSTYQLIVVVELSRLINIFMLSENDKARI
jgi:hypothetical protein